jgi:hypothetical protein
MEFFKVIIILNITKYWNWNSSVSIAGRLQAGLGHEDDQSSPSSPKVKKSWNCTSTPPYIFLMWYLVKPRDFTLPDITVV